MEVALTLAALSLVVASFALLVSLGTALRLTASAVPRRGRRTGLTSGTPVPTSVIDALARHLPTDPLAWLRGPSLVVFYSDSCSPCRDLVQELGAYPLETLRGRILMARLGRTGQPALSEAATFAATWVDDDANALRDAFRNDVFPHTFLIQDGLVAAEAVGPDLSDVLAKEQPAQDGNPAATLTGQGSHG